MQGTMSLFSIDSSRSYIYLFCISPGACGRVRVLLSTASLTQRLIEQVRASRAALSCIEHVNTTMEGRFGLTSVANSAQQMRLTVMPRL